MKKDEIRRYLPVGIFASITSFIIIDIGASLHLWKLTYNIFPFSNLFPYHLGAGPVVAMWLFKFTYGNFVKFITVDALLNLAFGLLLLPLLSFLGIRENIRGTYLLVSGITTLHAVFLYYFQAFLEGSYEHRHSFSINPAAAKPYQNYNDKNDSDE